MNPWFQNSKFIGWSPKNTQAMLAPLVVVFVLVPDAAAASFVLDLFFTFNIATALMVMMVAATMLRPLDFCGFSLGLLLTTLLRLSLNVAPPAWC